MHTAASAGDAETLRRLLDQGASPEDVTGSGRTPLHWLCYSNAGGDRIACFEILRAAGANLDAIDSAGCVPLHYAAEISPSLTSALIEAGASVNGGTSDRTPLHFAAGYRGRTCNITVPLLLRAGAEVNAKDRDDYTPLHLAIDAENRRILPVLLRAGATIPSHTDTMLGYTYRVSMMYVYRVNKAGGFKKYEQAHIGRITAMLTPTPRLPPEMVRNIVEFWLHAGYY